MLTGQYFLYSDYHNFEECVAWERREMELEEKKYGRFLFSWEKP